MKHRFVGIASLVIVMLCVAVTQARERVYTGRATTTITILDPLSGRIIQRRTFRKRVQVITNNPIRRETNDINLVIQAEDAREASDEGHFALFSAVDFGTRNAPLVLQYWELEQRGDEIFGELIDRHAAEALALNVIHSLDIGLLQAGVRSVVPVTMEPGVTTLDGTITNREVDLYLEGYTHDSFHRFKSRIRADR